VTPSAGRRSRRARRGRRLLNGLLLLVMGAAVFALGLAVGQALGEEEPPGQRVEVRTLQPLPLPPQTETVTVTVTVP
jgi:hypothetical protein